MFLHKLLEILQYSCVSTAVSAFTAWQYKEQYRHVSLMHAQLDMENLAFAHVHRDLNAANADHIWKLAGFLASTWLQLSPKKHDCNTLHYSLYHKDESYALR